MNTAWFYFPYPCIQQSLERWRLSAGANARRARCGFLGAGDRAPSPMPGALAAAYWAPAT
jgi:hypothetical protein